LKGYSDKKEDIKENVDIKMIQKEENKSDKCIFKSNLNSNNQEPTDLAQVEAVTIVKGNSVDDTAVENMSEQPTK
jgi:hypothetical protein